MGIFFRKKRLRGLDYIRKKFPPGHLTKIMSGYSQIDADALYAIWARGQRADKICQADVDSAKATVSLLINQTQGEKRARIKSLSREIDDLADQLSKPLDLAISVPRKRERPTKSIMESVSSIWKRSRSKGGKTSG